LNREAFLNLPLTSRPSIFIRGGAMRDLPAAFGAALID
jgi:hypothetical protein